MRTTPILRFMMTVLVLMSVLTGRPAHAASQIFTMTVNNPYCQQSMVESGACYINFRSITVSGGDTAFDHFDISIDGKVRTRMQTFFETTASLVGNMLGQGLKVTCGRPDAGGNPAFGNLYHVTVQAFAGGTSVATDSANVNCPYYRGPAFAPLMILLLGQ